MRFVRTRSSALGFGLVLGAALLGAPNAEAQAEDKPQQKQAPADSQAAKPAAAKPEASPASTANAATTTETPKKETATKRARRAPEQRTAENSDADLAARKPPPPSEALDPRRAKFTPVKTDGTGAGQAHDESNKLATPTNPNQPAAPVASAPPENETDEKLRERVQAGLLTDRKLPYTARMVSVAVKKGTITLSGEVNTDYERTRVAQKVDSMRGRHDVINQISVRNRSPEAVQATSR